MQQKVAALQLIIAALQLWNCNLAIYLLINFINSLDNFII